MTSSNLLIHNIFGMSASELSRRQEYYIAPTLSTALSHDQDYVYLLLVPFRSIIFSPKLEPGNTAGVQWNGYAQASD